MMNKAAQTPAQATTLRRVPKGSVPAKQDPAILVAQETERLKAWLQSWAASMSNDYSAVAELAGANSRCIEGRESSTNYMVADDDAMAVNDVRSARILRDLGEAIDSMIGEKLWAWWAIYRWHGLRKQSAGVWSFAALEADLAGTYARAVEQLRLVCNRRGIVL